MLSASTSIDAGVMLHGTNWHSPGFVTTEQYAAGDFDTVSNVTDGGFKRYARERVSIRVLLRLEPALALDTLGHPGPVAALPHYAT